MSDSISDELTPPAELAPPATHDVFIGNIPFDVDEETLNELIAEKTGDNFKPIKLIRDRETGRSRGFGYLKYDEKSEADEVIDALSGIELSGREIRVGHNEPRPNKRENRAPNPARSIFIGNIDFSANEDQLMDMCNDILGPGNVVRVRLATDRDTGRPKGFGHLDFQDEAAAARAVEELSGVTFLGRALRVDFARRREDGPAPRSPRSTRYNSKASIFLGNLAWDVSKELLEEMLDDVVGTGTVAEVRLAVDRATGRARGFAHVDFLDEAGAERALVELTGLELLGRPLRVDKAQRAESNFNNGSKEVVSAPEVAADEELELDSFDV